uniref:2'-5'-oligoadenylate synthetase 1 domain-containing protein n=1 Tax=Cricetulus griseus TaxID=10029 RepID=A0A8C2ME87_CRIGR
MELELNCTPAAELDKFIEDYLLSNSSFHNEVRAIIDIVCTFLKERCFRGADHPVRVSKVVKGGSSGKGKMLLGKWEADLVVFLNNLTCFEDQLRQRGKFIQEIKKQLCALQQEKTFHLKLEVQDSNQPNSQGLSFKLRSPQLLQQEVEFDVLLAYDVLGDVSINQKPEPYIYGRLIIKCTSLGLEGEFNTCFTELQGNFLKDRPPQLKNLIRLVKHWYQLCKEKLREPLPPQYALELLTVYAWERGSGFPEFNTAEGFRTVLELVTNYRQLRIYWTVYYDFQYEYVSNCLHKQLSRARPVILDPADPTRNVAGGNPLGWWLLAEEAVAWLGYPCVRNCDTSLVRSWDVPRSTCLYLQSAGIKGVCHYCPA